MIQVIWDKKELTGHFRTLDIIDLALLVVTDNSWGEFEDDLIKKFNDTGYSLYCNSQ